MPLFRTQSAAKQTSLAPHGSKARLRAVTKCRDSWRSHVHRTYIAQRVQLFKLQTRNVGGRGALPSPFSGGFKGGILFGKRIPPLVLPPARRIFPPRSARKATAPPRERKKEAALRGVQLRKHSKAREKRYSFGYAVSFIFACYQILWTFPKSLYLCSRYLLLAYG